MPTCELCGREVKTLVKSKVMGASLNVCERCASHGKLIPTKQKEVFKRKTKLLNKDLMVVDDAVSIIKDGLKRMNLDIRAFARAVNIKESTIHKVLSGKISLDISTARRIEKFLGVRLVSEVDVSEFDAIDEENNESEMTLGDLIKL